MTLSDEISIIANQLANQGKTPTVALVKSKLTQATPLPNIIKALKNWQHDPTFISMNVDTNDTNEQQDNKTFENEEWSYLIAQAIQPLQTELKEIKAVVVELKTQIVELKTQIIDNSTT